MGRTTTVTVLLFAFLVSVANAQDSCVVLTGKDSARVIPTTFYFEGLSAPTQMRNSAAARFGSKRYVIAGLVDTSGYSTDVRAKYQGFFITDSPITVGGKDLAAGAYGFGFSDAWQVQCFRCRRQRGDVGRNRQRHGAAPPSTSDDGERKGRPAAVCRAQLHRYRGAIASR